MNSITHNIIANISDLFPKAVFYKQTSSPIIALTIDDVGDAGTSQIIQVIDNFNQTISNNNEKIRVTFFVITDQVEDTKILDEILNQGHEIGNHGQGDRFHVLLDKAEFRTEITKADEILFSNQAKKDTKWFRPGRAFYNDQMLKVMRRMGNYYDKFALASMLPLDTLPLLDNPKFTIKYLSQFIFPGSILLLHGGSPKRTANTVEVLPQLLTKLRKEKYQVVTLSELWESK